MKNLGNIPMIGAVTKGLVKIMEANDLNRLGFEPEYIKCLIENDIIEI